MTRYIIIGAGAVGASLAAQFELTGVDYVLVGRGPQIAHIARNGLSYRRPDKTRILQLKTAETDAPPALTQEDILVLTVKTQDVEAATAFWAWRPVGGGMASDLRLLTLQNGLAAEDIALRRFRRVYAGSILIPARYIVTGEVSVAAEPQVGVVTIGQFPFGVDATAEQIVRDFAKAGYLAEASADIRRWKAAKLLHNVGNVTELFAGSDDARAEAASALSAEARTVLMASGYDPADPSERKKDISGWRIHRNPEDSTGHQSTWQSFIRGVSSEVDYLNGEIVRLSRIHGVPAPLNTSFQNAAAALARDGRAPGSTAITDIKEGACRKFSGLTVC